MQKIILRGELLKNELIPVFRKCRYDVIARKREYRRYDVIARNGSNVRTQISENPWESGIRVKK